MKDTTGLYSKYSVNRNDGESEPGGKHENCSYYVLDLEHDPFALHALRAYAKACAKRHPQLANDLRKIAASKRHDRSPSEVAKYLMGKPKV